MLSLRHSIGIRPPLATLVRGSKSVPDSRCYASPPPTEICALERVCTSYLLVLMVVTTQHSLQEAARFSGLHPSLFSKMLQSHAKVATTTLESLSKTQARQFAKTLERVNG